MGARGLLHRVFVREGRLGAGWRFLALLVLFFSGGSLLNPLLARIHFPDRTLDWYALSLNDALDFAYAVISWVVAASGASAFLLAGSTESRRGQVILVGGVMWGIVPSILILVPIYFAGACSFHGLALYGTNLAKYGALWTIAFLLVGLSE